MQAAVKFLLEKVIVEIKNHEGFNSVGQLLEVSEDVVVSVDGFDSFTEATGFYSTIQTVFDQVYKQKLTPVEVADRVIATIKFEILFK